MYVMHSICRCVCVGGGDSVIEQADLASRVDIFLANERKKKDARLFKSRVVTFTPFLKINLKF